MGSCYHLIKIESEKSNCFSRILNTIFFKFPFPVISGFSFKLIVLENSRGLNCQFDICSCVCMLISFFQKFQSFNSRNLARPYFSLLGNPILHFFSKLSPKISDKRKNVEILSTTPESPSINSDSTPSHRLDHQPLYGKGARAPPPKGLLGKRRRPDMRERRKSS